MRRAFRALSLTRAVFLKRKRVMCVRACVCACVCVPFALCCSQFLELPLEWGSGSA